MAVRNSAAQNEVERRAMNGGGAATSPRPSFRPVPEKSRHIVERKAPELWQWQGKGESLEGILQSVERVEVAEKINGKPTGQKKPAIEYIIFNEDQGQAFKMLGTHDINSKLSRSDIGKFVVIVYVGKNENVVKNGNAMMVFRVGVEEKQPAKFSDGTQITDADIPF